MNQISQRRADIYARALAKWGKNDEIMLALEEMAELSKELLKNINRGKDNIREITEELSDVYITLEQVRQIYNIPGEAIQSIVDEKIDRLEKRLNA
jgi:NTP pyrophosphatase (non-canonical NTP hydrolase)